MLIYFIYSKYPFQYVIHIKLLMACFTQSFCTKVLCVVYTYSGPQSVPATLHVLNSRMWPAATVLDSSSLSTS